MLIELHLSQSRISDSKREKVCAVCPYLLFFVYLYDYQSADSLPAFIYSLRFDRVEYALAWCVMRGEGKDIPSVVHIQ